MADSGFCEELAEYLGIKPSRGETAQMVLGVASWAMDKSEDPEEGARMALLSLRSATRSKWSPCRCESKTKSSGGGLLSPQPG